MVKALTISQPYASLIASGEKWVENRTWPTKYRGDLAIHAGKGTQYLTKAEIESQGLPFGQVIAIATLSDCFHLSSINKHRDLDINIPGLLITWRELFEHKHTEGPWCWLLTNVVKLDKPIDAKGAQGLWEWK
jgi:activating signal cointegrator 1